MTGFPVKDGFLRRLSTGAFALLVLGDVAFAQSEPPHSAALDAAIISAARRHGVPEKLVRRIVMRESKYNARAHNRAYWGLMQISYPTAKSMGFKGKPSDLLDPFVNLTYAVPYLANAFIIAGKQEDAAVRLYASGYYQTAKSRGVLDELRTADSAPVKPETTLLAAAAQPIANLATAVYNTPAAIQAAAEGRTAQAQEAQAQEAQAQEAAQAEQQAQAQQQAQAEHHAEAPQQAQADRQARLPIPPKASAMRGATAGRDPEIAMAESKSGFAPPKKWTRDGGLSVIAKGDQRLDKFAAYRLAGSSGAQQAASIKPPHGKPKLTVYAMLDPPPPSQQPPPAANPLMATFEAYAPAAPESGASQTAIAAVATPPVAPTLQLRGPVEPAATAATEPPQTKAAAKTDATTVVAKAAPAKEAPAAKPAGLAMAEAAGSADPAPATMPAIVAPPPPRREPVKLTALVLRGPETAPVTGNALVTRGLLIGAAAPLSASAFSPLPERVPDVKDPVPAAKPAVKAAAAHAAPARMAMAKPLAKALARTAAKPVQLHATGG